MNLAFGTLLLFLLITPGIAFRNAYIFGPLTKKNSKTSAFDDFAWGIIPGLVIQFIGVLIVNNNFKHLGVAIDFKQLGDILFTSSSSSRNSTEAFKNIQWFIWPILEYNLALIIGAALIGYSARKLVRGFCVDHLMQFLRFNNEWFYNLRGEFIFFSEQLTYNDDQRRRNKLSWLNKKNRDKQNWKNIKKKKLFDYLNFFLIKLRNFCDRNVIETCIVNATVRTDQGHCYIYMGYIHSFSLAKDGTLYSILIKGASRKRFFANEPSDKAYEIPTSAVILKNSEIVTISVEPILFKANIKRQDFNKVIAKKELIYSGKSKNISVIENGEIQALKNEIKLNTVEENERYYDAYSSADGATEAISSAISSKTSKSTAISSGQSGIAISVAIAGCSESAQFDLGNFLISKNGIHNAKSINNNYKQPLRKNMKMVAGTIITKESSSISS